ncbi:MAG: hypothetical protein AB7U83_21205 [Vicinamibacterales bacterium]
MRVTFIVLLVLGVGPSIAAQDTTPPPPPPDPLHDLFAGQWAGTGTILGQPARVELTVERVLDGRFTRLLWVSHIGLPPKTQRFEGHAYYPRPGWDSGYTATWFDSSGAVRPIRGGPDGADTVVALWGTAATEQGETRYRRVAPDAIAVVDRVLGTNGQWREFGRSSLTRVR